MTEEFIIRPGIFILALVLMLLWEWARPFRVFPEAKLRRLCRHLGLMLLNFACVRLLSGGGAYFTAGLVEARQWGLFNLYPLPEWLPQPPASSSWISRFTCNIGCSTACRYSGGCTNL